MQVSRVAYDRFELQLPPREPGWEPLAEGCVARDVAGWLWQFGPTPLIAIVEHDGAVPRWLTARLTVEIPWDGSIAAALVLEERRDLELFLVEGAPHRTTHFLWPRVSPAKTFEAMCAGGERWKDAVESHATVAPTGVVEVSQLQPV